MDYEKCELFVKDESVNVDRIHESIEQAMQEPFTVNEDRDDLLLVLARQVHANVKRGANLNQQIKQVAHFLHAGCHLESKRDRDKELTLESLETTLYTLVRELDGK